MSFKLLFFGGKSQVTKHNGARREPHLVCGQKSLKKNVITFVVIHYLFSICAILFLRDKCKKKKKLFRII